ncbi:FecR family protein [uncultured Algibacter sp.]|uniref:FecR family protein n=1 Tax=uncultured Algibacter sp. TaxID=298659 RepID=UPI002611AF1F|nr:FecR family protein [uncultured Algibacter sp.]
MKKIIVKFITNTITDQELKTLRDWLKKEKNQNTFEHYIKDYYDVNVLMTKPDIDKAYKKLWETINNEKKVRKIAPVWFRYAAAAAVVLMFSITYTFLSKNEPVIEVTDTIQESIAPGTDKATLTLADGKDVALEKGQLYQANSVTSNGEEIVYNKTATEVIAYNYLTTPRGGQFQITLADGTQVWLNSASKLKYPVAFKKGAPREVELVYGEAYFDVSTSENHNGATFKVRSNLQEVEVLGTEFNIKAYQDETEVYTTLAEGKVAVSNNKFKENLSVGQQSVLNSTTENIEIKVVNVYNETSWRKGIFAFRDKPLKDIMKVISRWYDVDIVFEDKTLETITFNGVLSKKMPLEDILTPIKKHTDLNYKVYDKKIVLD